MRTTYTKNKVIKREGYYEMILYNRKCKEIARTIFDIDDLEKVNKYKWCLHSGYAFTNIKGRLIGMHRIIMGDRNLIIDHKNINRLDNRKDNLRFVSHQVNSLNNNAIGVSRVGNSKSWRAYIAINNKQIHIGCFRNKDDAIKARNKFKEEIMNKLFE